MDDMIVEQNKRQNLRRFTAGVCVVCLVLLQCLVLGALPAQAYAQDGDLTVKAVYKDGQTVEKTVSLEEIKKIKPTSSQDLTDEDGATITVTGPSLKSVLSSIGIKGEVDNITYTTDAGDFVLDSEDLGDVFLIHTRADDSGKSDVIPYRLYTGETSWADVESIEDFQVNRSINVTTKMTVSPGTKSLKEGKTVTLKVDFPLEDYFGSNGGSYSEDITWKSSDTSVATVNSQGKVTAKKAGSATITATSASGLKATATVKVTAKETKATTKPTTSASATRSSGTPSYTGTRPNYTTRRTYQPYRPTAATRATTRGTTTTPTTATRPTTTDPATVAGSSSTDPLTATPSYQTMTVKEVSLSQLTQPQQEDDPWLDENDWDDVSWDDDEDWDDEDWDDEDWDDEDWDDEDWDDEGVSFPAAAGSAAMAVAACGVGAVGRVRRFRFDMGPAALAARPGRSPAEGKRRFGKSAKSAQTGEKPPKTVRTSQGDDLPKKSGKRFSIKGKLKK